MLLGSGTFESLVTFDDLQICQTYRKKPGQWENGETTDRLEFSRHKKRRKPDLLTVKTNKFQMSEAQVIATEPLAIVFSFRLHLNFR